MSNQQEIFKKYEQKISEYEQHLEHLSSTKNDYRELVETLTTLPNTLQPKIMVPLGKLAFFEGNLKSTNEILILLGDNYFAKRSSKQTIDIIQRRDKDIDISITELKEQIKGLKQRVTLTTDISKAMNEKDHDNIIEIKEEYDEEKEKELEKKRNQTTTTTTTSATNTETTNTTNTTPVMVDKKKKEEMDKEFEKMLKRLSILEEKEKKMGDDYDEEDFNRKFNKKLNVTNDIDEDEIDGGYNEEDDEYNYGNDVDDDDDGDDDGVYENDDEYDEENENENHQRTSSANKISTGNSSRKEFRTSGNDQEDDEEVIEYYDEFGNIVDINDPNVEYIQDDDNDNNQDDDNDDETDEAAVDGEDFDMDKNDLSEKEIKELTDFYHSKQKKRITYIDTPQPPTPESHTTTTPKSILKTNPSNNLTNIQQQKQPYNENDENDVRRYIMNLGKQDSFENNKTISVPNPPKDIAFSGDIVEKQTDLFPFDEIPKPAPSNSKQSRFKSSRLNK